MMAKVKSLPSYLICVSLRVGYSAVFNCLNIRFVVGANAGTAAVIFETMNEIFQHHEIPWSNCIAASVDNTSVKTLENIIQY